MRVNTACELFDALVYPLSSDELARRVGENEVELPDGAETIGEVLDRFETDTFESAEEARLMFLSALGPEAVGRVGYTDRDPPTRPAESPDLPSF
ncbi:MAG: DUF2795 domain-containing protein [Halobacteriales archaeon]